MKKYIKVNFSSRFSGEPEVFTVILGMHRSGTSLLTNILSKAGFFAGKDSDLIKGDRWNRDGYFERWPVMKVNDMILNLFGGSWHMPPEEKNILKVRIDPRIETLLKIYKRHSLSIIKDPRLCLVFPVWQREFGSNVRVVRITRHPDAVAASLMERDGIVRQKSLYLWRTYNERACKYTRGYPVFDMRYEDLFIKSRHEILSRLSLFLEIGTDLEKIAAQVVDPSLMHHCRDSADFNNSKKTDSIASQTKHEIPGRLICKDKKAA